MIGTLEEIERSFNSSLDSILTYIDMFERTLALDFSQMKKSKFYSNLNLKKNEINTSLSLTKNVQYNAIIISLYGAFELTIKKAVNAYIFKCISSNRDVASNFKKNYLLSVAKSFERNNEITNNNLLASLNKLFNYNDATGFNEDYSLNNVQNVKTNVIQEVASLIGINDILTTIKQADEFVEFIMSRERFENKEQAQEYLNTINNPFSHIDEIVDRRNKIAHEGREENMLAKSIIKESYIPEFKVFIHIYIKLIKIKWLEFECCESNKLSIIKIFDGKVICFNTGNRIIKGNDIILIKMGSDLKIANIVSMQFNNANIDISETHQDIGCKLDKKCKPNYEYFIIQL